MPINYRIKTDNLKFTLLNSARNGIDQINDGTTHINRPHRNRSQPFCSVSSTNEINLENLKTPFGYLGLGRSRAQSGWIVWVCSETRIGVKWSFVLGQLGKKTGTVWPFPPPHGPERSPYYPLEHFLQRRPGMSERAGSTHSCPETIPC
jgi:hypothetical protein